MLGSRLVLHEDLQNQTQSNEDPMCISRLRHFRGHIVHNQCGFNQVFGNRLRNFATVFMLRMTCEQQFSFIIVCRNLSFAHVTMFIKLEVVFTCGYIFTPLRYVAIVLTAVLVLPGCCPPGVCAITKAGKCATQLIIILLQK